ncbi:hypothetical protein CONLIGDRAFT_269411 [Coniochaeta ligniaria NRRL 30616]|uniref:Uncharacterized protein n=1 Tax=Coniochaeta ligniaria NRRL 30616 TaxID=1408157 RepID=A0A1J7JXA8_9PEZI|nr:hypothetical protein CONLIGDRAFT_269411 [Coniochaeta ligniaria NRRL 30616]
MLKRLVSTRNALCTPTSTTNSPSHRLSRHPLCPEQGTFCTHLARQIRSGRLRIYLLALKAVASQCTLLFGIGRKDKGKEEKSWGYTRLGTGAGETRITGRRDFFWLLQRLSLLLFTHSQRFYF